MKPTRTETVTTDESTDDQTGNPSEDQSGERSEITRRPLLKALGAGATLALGSGVAVAQQDESQSPEIDPFYGYSTPNAEEIPAALAPDYEVELHVDQPDDLENPDHPTFFHFEPTGLHVEPGSVVQFSLEAPDHTITAYHPAFGFQRRVPTEAPPFSSPVLNIDGAWLYRFSEPGLYDMYCGPHHILGMNMRIVVGEMADGDVPAYEETFEGSEDPPLLAPFSKRFLERELNAFSERNEFAEWPWLTPQEVLDADVLDPGNVQDQGEVSFDAVIEELDRFGR